MNPDLISHTRISVPSNFHGIHFSKEEPSLTESIEKALKDDEAKEKELVKEPEKKEVKEEPKVLTDEEKTDQEQALKLWKALNDPATSKDVIALLAKNVGLTEDSTKKDVKETVKGIEELIKEALGDEYSFLSEKFTIIFKGIEKQFNNKLELTNKQLEEDKKLKAEEKQEAITTKAYEKLESTYSNLKDVEPEMEKLMKSIKPSSNESLFEYFETLAITAAARKDIKLVKVGKAQEKVVDIEKARRNAKDASLKLSSEETSDHKEVSTAKNAKEAVEMAIEQLSKLAK